MRIGYFPGCSLEGTSREYGESVRAVGAALGVELVEVRDWNCCGATAAHSLNHKLALALPARTLALAEKQGLDEVLVPCSACFSRLAATRRELAHDEALRREIAEIVELPYAGRARPVNVLELLGRVAANGLKERVRQPFGRKVACYYGCYLARPAELTGCRRVEDPQEMDEIVRVLGATPIDWAFKVECCGAALSVTRTDIVAELSGRILGDAVDRGAEAVVVACPLCHTNLDLRRQAIEQRQGREFTVPVLYITQLVGLALGLDGKTLGLHRHNVPVRFAPIPQPATGETPVPQKKQPATAGTAVPQASPPGK